MSDDFGFLHFAYLKFCDVRHLVLLVQLGLALAAAATAAQAAAAAEVAARKEATSVEKALKREDTLVMWFTSSTTVGTYLEPL